jgi:transcriptional activator of cad operon
MNNTALSDNTGQWQLGELIFDSRSRQLRLGDQQRYLEPRQYQLLLSLLASAEQPLSRDQLIQTVWHGRIVSDGAINRAISMLRKAFASLDPDTNYIETLPKLGYRLAPEVNTLILPATDGAATPAIAGASGRLTAPVWLTARVWLTAGLLVVLFCAAFWFTNRSALPLLVAGDIVPHTSFNGRESQLSSNLQARVLLYQRTAGNGKHQIWLNTLSDNQHVALTASSADSRNAALSPDGSQFAFVQYSNDQCQIILQQLTVPPAAEQRQVLHPCPADNVPLLSWQADGTALYLRQRPDKTQPYLLYKLSIASKALRQLTLMPANYTGLGDIALAGAARQTQLALLRYLSADSSELQILDSNSGDVIHTQALPVRATALAWFNDKVLLLSAGQMLYQYHLDGAGLSPLYHAADAINSFVVANDVLYLSSTELRTDIWQAEPQGAPAVRINSSRLDTIPRLSHDGTQLAFLSTRQGHEQVWLQRSDGSEQLLSELPGTPGFIRPEWSADDKFLLFSKDAAAYQLDTASGELQTLLGAEKQVGVVNWGGNNSLLYSSHRNGDWQLWQHDLATGSEQQLTEQGGYSGHIWQGRLYFSKYHQDGLWYKTLPAGPEQLLLAQFDKINWLNWHIDQGQLYYYQPGEGIYRLNLASGDNTLQLAEPDDFVRHFNVRQGKIVFVRYREVQGDIYRLPLTLSP